MPALADWTEHRRQQGITLRFVESAETAGLLKQRLTDAGLGAATPAIILIGDCRLAADAADRDSEVPTFYRAAGPTAKWGTTPVVAGDAPYGDLDGDGVPEIPVGRIPIDSLERLDRYVQRVIEYETSRDFGIWRDTVQITAGLGGFGFFADAAIESATRSILTSTVPESTRLQVTYCSPTSNFNPGPNDFFPAVLRRYREGSLFWVYLGHGQVTELDRVPGPGGSRRPVLACDDVSLLEQSPSCAPIAVMLACYTGAFDASVDSLAERMLLADQGPVAVLAGSRVTMPYGNAVAAQGLIHSVYADRSDRLGAAWLAAQRELATDASEDQGVAQRRQMVDMLAAAISPSTDLLPEERLEHVHLYNLLGDPLLRIAHPGTVALDVPRGVTPGQPIRIRGIAPHAGRLQISVRYPPGSVPDDSSLSPSQRYERANDGEVARVEVTPQSAGPFEATVVLSPEVRGPMRVVARLEGDHQWSVGSSRLLVRPE
jgi:hypothetical protein